MLSPPLTPLLSSDIEAAASEERSLRQRSAASGSTTPSRPLLAPAVGNIQGQEEGPKERVPAQNGHTAPNGCNGPSAGDLAGSSGPPSSFILPWIDATASGPGPGTSQSTKSHRRTRSNPVNPFHRRTWSGGSARSADEVPRLLDEVLDTANQVIDSANEVMELYVERFLMYVHRPDIADRWWWRVTIASVLLWIVAVLFLAWGIACFCPMRSLGAGQGFKHSECDAPLRCLNLFFAPEFPAVLADIVVSFQILSGGAVMWKLGAKCISRLREIRRQRSFDEKMRAGMGEAENRAAGRERMLLKFKETVAAMHDSRLSVDLSLKGLSFQLPNGTEVLKDVSGELRHGCVTALMGPSGCGKTTLMTLLAGRLRPSRGKITHSLGGRPCNPRAFRRLQGFVPQNDVMIEALTVKEQLWFSAAHRLPTDLSQEPAPESRPCSRIPPT